VEKKKSSVVKIMRALHRDVGFLMIGLMVIYGVSGIQLNLKGSNLFTTSSITEMQLSPNMSVAAVASELRIRNTRGVTTEGDIITFNNGSTYNSLTGELVSVVRTVIWPIDRFNALHKSGGTGLSNIITTTSAVLLCFLAISAFWMYKPKNKNFKRGIILAIIGFALSVYVITFTPMGPRQNGGQEAGGMQQSPQGEMPQRAMPGGH